MHKRNLEKETDSVRKARARQERLDEINDKVERAKHKTLRTNYQEKVKVLNELTTIHRVFEPLYAIQEDQERLTHGTPAEKAENSSSDATTALEQLPRLLKRAESESTASETSRKEMKMSQCLDGKKQLTSNPNGERHSDSPTLPRPRSHSWSRQSPPSIEPEQTRSAFQIKRDYIAKLRSAAKEPRVSDSMSSVTLGYLAFKRVLKNKRRPETMARNVLGSKFRSMSLDETELSVIPELVEQSGVESQWTTPAQASPSTVNKDNRQNLGFSRHLLVPVGKRPLCSALSWPLSDLTLTEKTPGSARPPHKLLYTKAVQQEDLLANRHSSSNIDVTEPAEKEEKKNFRTFNTNSKQKTRYSHNNRIRFSRTYKLLRPLGTGCFSESFQTVHQ